MAQHEATAKVDESTPPVGRLLPPQCFTSASIYAREIGTLFHRSWVHVADLPELREAGDYVTARIGTNPVLVVRGEDGQVRSFFNVCLHRGATVASGAGNCGKSFVCPYHAWTYACDGKLLGVPEKDDFAALERSRAQGLIPVRTATLGPLVFACLSEDAPDFDVWVGSQGSRFLHDDVEAMEPACAFDYEVSASWKLFVENGLEGYHLPFVHDMLDDFVETKSAEHFVEDWSSYTHATVKPQFRDLVRMVPEYTNPKGPFVQFGFVFPNLLPVINAVDLTYIRIDPAGPGRIKLRVRSFDRRNREAMALREYREESIDRTTKQDIAIVERVYEGMHAQAYPGGYYASFLERRVRHFEEIYCREMGGVPTSPR